jgi:hypothetical protein
MRDLIYSDKILMTVVLVIFDIIFVCILYTQKLNTFDKTYIYISLIFHIVFYKYLWHYNKDVIYVLHILMIPMFISSLLVKNKYIIMALLFILISILSMWIFLKRCPLNEKNEHLFGGPYTPLSIINYIGSFILLVILIYKVINCKPLT